MQGTNHGKRHDIKLQYGVIIPSYWDQVKAGCDILFQLFAAFMFLIGKFLMKIQPIVVCYYLGC